MVPEASTWIVFAQGFRNARTGANSTFQRDPRRSHFQRGVAFAQRCRLLAGFWFKWPGIASSSFGVLRTIRKLPQFKTLFNALARRHGYSELRVYLVSLEGIVRLIQCSFAAPLVLLASMPIAEACCLGDDNGSHVNSVGLGQSNPSADDVSLDPSWRVYEFTRDGIEYFQVNDLAGRVQLIVGSLDGVFWALPAGETSSPMVLPPHQMPVRNTALRSEVYSHPAFSLVRYRNGDSAVWVVEASRALP